MYSSKIVADSIADNGCRLTTFEVTYPLIIHAEIMTHRVFSRNVASNRAIPVKKLVASVQDFPFIPEKFPANKAGMQNNIWLEGNEEERAIATWLEARDSAVRYAEYLGNTETGLGVHKQITNRLLAPFLWTTAVITATEWKNFFSLRVDTDLTDSVDTWKEYSEVNDKREEPFPAQREIQSIAFLMYKSYKASSPKQIKQGEWHLPYINFQTGREVAAKLAGEALSNSQLLSPSQFEKEHSDKLIKISTGRCARVSYLNHGENNLIEKDLSICEGLLANHHMSPSEHPATPLEDTSFCGNFRGWKQYRKFIDGESGE